MTIAETLGFVHGSNGGGDPCRGTDDDLIFVERYVGVESRRIRDLSRQPDLLVLGVDALSDETERTIEQYVECRYCDGPPVTVPGLYKIEYE